MLINGINKKINHTILIFLPNYLISSINLLNNFIRYYFLLRVDDIEICLTLRNALLYFRCKRFYSNSIYMYVILRDNS